jgi:phosphatidylinositol glycan class B
MKSLFSGRPFYKILFFFVVLVYFITAFNSHGFYHADEHYQIIEFAGLKLGTNSTTELAWEYEAQIRPALQPTVCFAILKALNFIKITDPYSQAFMLRLLTAIMALLIISYFVKQSKDQFKSEKTKKTYYLLSFLLWFIPLISVRFSSETWSGLLFLLSLGIFLNSETGLKKPLLIGVVLGFSFLFRFQTIFLIFGFLFWLLIIKKQLRFILQIGIGFLPVLLIGFLIDSWFYNIWVFTTWNYFYVNIIEGAASGFGVSPWYYYLEKLITFPSYFIGIPLAVAFITLIIKRPKNIYLWCIIPFFVIHSIIPHKEERFLFPIVFLFPIILITAYEILLNLIKPKVIANTVKSILIVIFISVNTFGLIAMSIKSAGTGRMEITKYIHDNYRGKQINLIFCPYANPYNPWQSLPVKFYLEKNMTEVMINNLCELNDSLYKANAENFLVIRRVDLENNECRKTVSENNFVLIKQSLPKWEEYINQYYKGFENSEIIMLYRLAK